MNCLKSLLKRTRKNDPVRFRKSHAHRIEVFMNSSVLFAVSLTTSQMQGSVLDVLANAQFLQTLIKQPWWGSSQGQWIQNPRVLQCVNNIQLGAKMGQRPSHRMISLKRMCGRFIRSLGPLLWFIIWYVCSQIFHAVNCYCVRISAWCSCFRCNSWRLLRPVDWSMGGSHAEKSLGASDQRKLCTEPKLCTAWPSFATATLSTYDLLYMTYDIL